MQRSRTPRTAPKKVNTKPVRALSTKAKVAKKVHTAKRSVVHASRRVMSTDDQPSEKTGDRTGDRRPYVAFSAQFGSVRLGGRMQRALATSVLPDGTTAKWASSDMDTEDFSVLFSYPKDFTFVCPTELLAMSDKIAEFEALGAKVYGISVDSVESHQNWLKTPRNKGGIEGLAYPLISDESGFLTRAIGAWVPGKKFGTRATLIFSKGTLRHASYNEPGIGRNADEILRLVQAYKQYDESGELCQASWKPGQKSINPEKADEFFAEQYKDSV